MPVTWRAPGASVGDIRIANLDGDQIVIHYGGALTSVDAYTFANSLVSFADAVRAINQQINPGQNVEIRVEAVGPGSFRAAIRKLPKGVAGFFTRGAEAVFWGIVATLIYDLAIDEDRPPAIIVNSDEVIIQHGGDRIIVPREVYERTERVKKDPEVRRNLKKTFDVIEQDPAIENFGLTRSLSDETPLIQIPRAQFGNISSAPTIVTEDQKRRSSNERARLPITKAWLTPGSHKWAFEWNGVPMSARVKDEEFLQRVEAREYLIGAGDALDATIKFEQDFDAATDMWANDVASYVITKVHRIISRDRGQQQLV